VVFVAFKFVIFEVVDDVTGLVGTHLPETRRYVSGHEVHVVLLPRQLKQDLSQVRQLPPMPTAPPAGLGLEVEFGEVGLGVPVIDTGDEAVKSKNVPRGQYSTHLPSSLKIGLSTGHLRHDESDNGAEHVAQL
jgi:hypothetical protein